MSGMGLVAIKRRIKSVTNTTKITRAMGLVATSKYKKIKALVDTNNNYFDKLEETVKHVKINYQEDNVYLSGNKNITKLYIVLTSDAGLCGGFNWSVVNKMIISVKGSVKDYNVIIVGQKGRSLLKNHNIETVAEYVETSDTPIRKEAATIMDRALSMYNSGQVGEVNIVYKKLISALKDEVIVEKLLPLNFDNDNNSNKEYVDIQAVDETAMQEIISLYLSGKMLNCMLHSKASEHRARMESMGSATRNANDMLDELNLSYNRIRQSEITQAISEIVGGAEAQK